MLRIGELRRARLASEPASTVGFRGCAVRKLDQAVGRMWAWSGDADGLTIHRTRR